MKIAVGSTNPVKIAAASAVLGRAYGTVEVVGLAVPSGVPDQPWGDVQTRQGAVNRARRALAATGADLGLGLEGGNLETEYGVMTCAWCAIVDREGAVGIGGGVNVLLPPPVVDAVRGGAELGTAMDRLTGQHDTKRHMGAVGILTGGLSSRQAAYEHLVTMALTRFVRAGYYEGSRWAKVSDRAPFASVGDLRRSMTVSHVASPLLVSGCLLGLCCRYDGGTQPHPPLQALAAQGRAIPICPEVAAGLPTPRPPAEIRGGDGGHVLDGRARVVRADGTDVTAAFVAGAEAALQLARRYGVTEAVLKSYSPSCGVGRIYDGTFSGRLMPGDGVTAALLERAGIAVKKEVGDE